MAGQLFSPLVNRFRRSGMDYDSERLLENDTEIPLGNLSAETADLSLDLSILHHRDQTLTGDQYLHDARVSNENSATKVTVIAPSRSSPKRKIFRKIFHFLGVTLAIFPRYYCLYLLCSLNLHKASLAWTSFPLY